MEPAGRISIAPYNDTCKYCPYKAACGIDRKVPGYKFREENTMSRTAAIAALCAKYDKSEDKKSGKGGDEDGV